MRTFSLLAVTAASASLMLAACSGGGDLGDPLQPDDDAQPTVAAPSAGSGGGEAASGASGDVNCDAIAPDALDEFSYGVQILAQLQSQDQIDLIREDTVVLDLDSFDAILADLGTLAGDPADPFGDPAESLDLYARASAAARAMVESGGEVPQADFDAYAELTGGIGEFIAAQAPVSASYSAYCSG